MRITSYTVDYLIHDNKTVTGVTTAISRRYIKIKDMIKDIVHFYYEQGKELSFNDYINERIKIEVVEVKTTE